MKRNIIRKVNILLLITSVLFILGCNNNPGEQTDVINTLSAPSLKSIAYPGVTYVYWDKVPHAKNGYRVDVYENNVLIEDFCEVLDQNVTFFADTYLHYGVEKTYKVSAIGDSQARALYFTDSSTSTIKVMPIVPPSTYKPLEFGMFEAGYNETAEYSFTSDATVLSEKTIYVEKNLETKTFAISFPAKPYLQYEVFADSINSASGKDYFELNGTHESSCIYYSDISIPVNTTVTLSGSFNSDNYNIYVVAEAYSDYYTNTNTVKIVPNNTSLLIDLIDSDNDGYEDDAQVIIALPSDKYTLNSVKYASANTYQQAVKAAENGTALTYTEGYKVYKFDIPNAVTVDSPVFAVQAAVVKDGCFEDKLVNTITYKKSSFDFTVTNIELKCEDNDNLYNDVAFSVMSAKTDKIKVLCAYGNTPFVAEALLESSEAITVAELSGYNFYEISGKKFEALKDIPLNTFIAVKVVSEGNESATPVEKVLVTKKCTYDNTKNIYTPEALINVKNMAMDSDGIVNDVYVTIEIKKDQTLSGLAYAVATTDELEEFEDLNIERLFSEKRIDLLNSITTKYFTDNETIFQVSLKDIPLNNLIAVQAKTSAPNKADNYAYEVADKVINEVVVLETTADPYIDNDALFFTCLDNDSKFNDLDKTKYDLVISVNQSIDSIQYVCAKSAEEAEKLLRAGSTIAKQAQIPDEFELVIDDSGSDIKLYKDYIITMDSIKNIEYGTYVYAIIVISEPGYLNNEVYMSTVEKTIELTEPESLEINVPAYSSERKVQKPLFTVDDGKNYEYVHVNILDNLSFDKTANYKYKLQRTEEKYYQEGNPIWETIEDNVVLSKTLSGFYQFDQYYKDIPVGSYVYRLTKTRKETKEAVVMDADVYVDYYVEAPEVVFSSYVTEDLAVTATENIDSNYDSLNNWDYELAYTVTYTTFDYEYITTDPVKITGWEWEQVITESPVIQTYRIKNAKITDINRDDCMFAEINVILTKTRKIEGTVTDFTDCQVRLNWVMNITISQSGSCSLSSSSYTQNEKLYLRLSTGTNYDSYTWYVDGVAVANNSNSLTICVDDWNYGSHDILVIVEKDGITDSASAVYFK